MCDKDVWVSHGLVQARREPGLTQLVRTQNRTKRPQNSEAGGGEVAHRRQDLRGNKREQMSILYTAGVPMGCLRRIPKWHGGHDRCHGHQRETAHSTNQIETFISSSSLLPHPQLQRTHRAERHKERRK